jgi:hypothetical protein
MNEPTIDQVNLVGGNDSAIKQFYEKEKVQLIQQVCYLIIFLYER